MQSSPTDVTPPPPRVPPLRCAYSKIWQRRPTTSSERSPRVCLRSCGAAPTVACEKTVDPSPIVVCPATTTCECRHTPSPSTAWGPTTQNGPICTPRPSVAAPSTMALGWIVVGGVGAGASEAR
eukprot:6323785-Prymnesium_polylepis.1